MNTPFELGQMIKAMAGGIPGADMDMVALQAARAGGGSDQSTLETYVRSHSQSGTVDAALSKTKGRFALARFALYALGAILGVAAVATAVLGKNGGTLNIFWLLAALLGPACISLAIWLILLWRRPQLGDGFSLATAAKTLASRFGPSGQLAAIAAQVVGRQQLEGALGRWRMSLTSHVFWLVYLVCACAAFVLIMAFQRYLFTWETTLLTPDQAIGLFDALRRPVAQLGLPAPSLADIRAAQSAGAGPTEGQNNQIWAQFTLALLALYGVVPRLLALAISKAFEVLHARRQKLSSTAPFFAAIAAQIHQPAADVRTIDPDKIGVAAGPQMDANAVSSARFKAACVAGWEIDAAALACLSPAQSLGVFDREDALLNALSTARKDAVAIAVSLLNTPDRGTARILAAARKAASDPVSFVLLHQSDLTERLSAQDAQRRLADWWSLLMQLGARPEDVSVHTALQPENLT